jgi:hypothetical protein
MSTVKYAGALATMLTTLQGLQEDFKDSDLRIDDELFSVELELDHAAQGLRAGLAAAGQDDHQRCVIAAELIASWAADCEFSTVAELPDDMGQDLRYRALRAVLLDDDNYITRSAAMDRLKPLLEQAIAVSDREALVELRQIRADHARWTAEQQHLKDIEHAIAFERIDRETLGIAADVVLSHEVIAAAQVKAEQAGGLSKRGKPLRRFANAAQRLTLTLERAVLDNKGDLN